MYRVELKALHTDTFHTFPTLVPNVPCGVERLYEVDSLVVNVRFLMYRVELKGTKNTLSFKTKPCS